MEITSLFAGAGVLILRLGGLALAPLAGAAAVSRPVRRRECADDGTSRGRLRWSCSCRRLRRRLDPAAPAPAAAVRYSSLSLVRDARPARRASGATCRSRSSSSASAASSSRWPDRSAIVSVPTGQTTDHPRDGRLAEHVLDRHPAQPTAGRRGRRRVVHRDARARRPRSASSRSPGSPRSSRPRPPTRRCCSTSSRA